MSSDWVRLQDLGMIHSKYGSPFFAFYVGADSRDSTQNAVSLYQGGLMLRSRDDFVGKDPDTDPHLLALKGHISRMMALFDPANADASTFEARARAMVRCVSS